MPIRTAHRWYFLPGTVTEPFRASVSSVPRVSFLEGSAGQDLLEAAKSIPSDLVAKSPFYQLDLNGEAPAQSTWIMPIPNDSEPYETLDVYTWEPQSQSWQWLPHNIIREDDQVESTSNALPLSAMVVQTNPRPALVAVDVAQAKDMPAESVGAVAQVAPTGLYLGGNGAIDGAVDATFDQAAGAYAVMPVIRNYEGPIVRSDLLANMLVDSAQRATHIDNLVNLAVGNNVQRNRHRLPRAGQESARRIQSVHQGAGGKAACPRQRPERTCRAGRAGCR